MTVHHGDCLEVMPTLDADSVDAIVTDPPYHLTTGKKGGTGIASLNPNSPAGRSRVGTGFMGKAWDGGDIAFRVETWAEALRVAKPGAHLVAFGGTRTYHRLTCAIEDAGWEIRDCLSWLYGSGFPKSHNGPWGGTALKPAWEPIILARKPLAGTVAANVQAHGTGALNIDGCRVGFASEADERESKDKNRHADFGSGPRENKIFGADNRSRGAHGNYNPPGRWPANVVLDEDAARLLDEQSGETTGSGPREGVRGGHKFGGEKGPKRNASRSLARRQRRRIPVFLHREGIQSRTERRAGRAQRPSNREAAGPHAVALPPCYAQGRAHPRPVLRLGHDGTRCGRGGLPLHRHRERSRVRGDRPRPDSRIRPPVQRRCRVSVTAKDVEAAT